MVGARHEKESRSRLALPLALGRRLSIFSSLLPMRFRCQDGDSYAVDASQCGNIARMLNHSCDVRTRAQGDRGCLLGFLMLRVDSSLFVNILIGLVLLLSQTCNRCSCSIVRTSRCMQCATSMQEMSSDSIIRSDTRQESARSNRIDLDGTSHRLCLCCWHALSTTSTSKRPARLLCVTVRREIVSDVRVKSREE